MYIALAVCVVNFSAINFLDYISFVQSFRLKINAQFSIDYNIDINCISDRINDRDGSIVRRRTWGSNSFCFIEF